MIYVVYAPVGFGEAIQTVSVTENLDNAIHAYIQSGHSSILELWEDEKEIMSYGYIKWHNHDDAKLIKVEVEHELEATRKKLAATE